MENIQIDLWIIEQFLTLKSEHVQVFFTHKYRQVIVRNFEKTFDLFRVIYYENLKYTHVYFKICGYLSTHKFQSSKS